jgi:hypothetical protein
VRLAEMSDALLNESRELVAKARDWLAAMPEEQTGGTQHGNTTKKERSITMNNEATPQNAAQLYTEGKTVIEVARHFGITYGNARKLIKASGTPIRDASARLKGRTRATKA